MEDVSPLPTLTVETKLNELICRVNMLGSMVDGLYRSKADNCMVGLVQEEVDELRTRMVCKPQQ